MAVAYARCSTDRQEQSIPDQLEAVRRYAQDHRLHILRAYVDDAVTGTRADIRRAFQQLVRDASGAACDFGVVLVYDVKRFGRVDNDEAGHYRWLLRQAGVQVAYVAEGFVGSSLDDLIRPVKQWQAREEARDLSRVTIRGLLARVRRDAQRGLWLGGFPPHGFDLRYEAEDGRFRFVVRYMPDGTRALLSAKGEVFERLPRRQFFVVSKSDRCRLCPSAPERIESIRLIFRLYDARGLGPDAIAGVLNRSAVPTARSPLWSERCSGLWRGVTVENILRNPAHVGDIAWNRRTLARFYKIDGHRAVERLDINERRVARNSEEEWIWARNVHPPLVDRALWDRVQSRLKANAKF